MKEKPKLNLTMAISGSPCHECDERHQKCHSECEKYIAYHEKCKNIRKQKESERQATPEFSRTMQHYAWRKSMGR